MAGEHQKHSTAHELVEHLPANARELTAEQLQAIAITERRIAVALLAAAGFRQGIAETVQLRNAPLDRPLWRRVTPEDCQRLKRSEEAMQDALRELQALDEWERRAEWQETLTWSMRVKREAA